MRLIQRCIVLAVFCLLSLTAAEAACKPSGNVLFQDQFDALAPSWGTSDNYHVEGGKLVIQPPAGYNTATINNASLYDDVDMCVEMTVPPPVKKNNCGGVIFWAADYDNYYSLQVSTDGQAAVWRRQKGKWLNQVAWQDFAAVRKSANQINEMRVTIAGSKAKLFVNGKLFKEVSGQPPQGGSQVGLLACSPNNASAVVDFDNFVVAGQGAGAAAAAAGSPADFGAGALSGDCQATDKTLFQDSFKELAASWGTFENYHVEAGKLVIQPPAGYNTATINNASLYDDVDICAEMNVPAPLVKNNCGSVIFWAVDYDNYYSLQVSTDGQASVWRRQKGKWLNQVSWQDFGAVHAAANQVNTLRVVTAGNRARFFVNGQLFKELTGQPPPGGSQVGLLACSPNNASARVEFTNFVVSGPGGTPAAAPEASADLGSGGAKTGTKCPVPKDALFSDQFETLAASWGTYDNYKVDNGELLVTPPAGYNTTVINTASLYDDIDICVGMKARPPVPQGTCAALVIWAEDYDNYYSFQVSTDGQASFWRRQRGKWLNQVAWQAADGVNTGEGFNQLRVTTTGQTAKLFINGKLFKEVQGQPPASGQEIGVLACAGEKVASAVGFDNLVVAGAGTKVAEANPDRGVEKKVPPEVKPVAPEVKPVPPEVKPIQPEVKLLPPEVKPDQAAVVPQGRRVALVIGVGAYKAVPALVNPPRDAAAVASELQDLGFDVMHLDNLDKTSMRRALQDFEDKAAGAAVALVYFAGHGMEVNGVNYLIPADAVLARASSIDDDAVSLPRVLLAVQHAQLRIVLLDACRNNPFPMVSADGSRALSRGLARVEPQSSTVIVFSAKEGTTADDGGGQNSPFANALLANMKKPGLEIGMLFRTVTEQVKQDTGGLQEPFVYASLGASAVYLAGK
jgi:regulation of enolase protein 1 (concanavalin A-like superfamily)